jgi:cell division protein FtsI (penicillin-binding protein 3)
MIPEQKKVMLRYTTLVLFFALMSVCIIVKAGLIMFAERQYWKDVADRFVKENVAIPPTRGNIISADGKLMASSLPCPDTCLPVYAWPANRKVSSAG